MQPHDVAATCDWPPDTYWSPDTVAGHVMVASLEGGFSCTCIALDTGEVIGIELTAHVKLGGVLVPSGPKKENK